MAAARITAVRKGQLATFECENGLGWIRQPCPDDGMIRDGHETTIFVPVSELRRVLAELDAPRERRRG